MTRAEFLAMYGEKAFTIQSYYKYQFMYSDSDGGEVDVFVGGNADDIYRAHAMPTMTLNKLLDQFGSDNAAAYINDGPKIDLEEYYYPDSQGGYDRT